MSRSTIMKISPQGQIRIPKKIMIALGIEKGDYVEVDVEERQIVLKPRKLIDPSQGWYWTKEWQKMEARVDDEIKEGHVSPRFKTAEEGSKWLKK
ncbi:MAG: AbrB/MazE/SpoVT family DNA-binding domain-containing protein [Desulfosarcina sp.]|nr:AbrB/MazE/SpoVT family DNA-binding domain-containing protein [Desulfosarcina sp.]MBC2741987.1 AbrB/MazE/SpoVT family DNA-binding domain-containing protein [Desulfosarcina sp.]MBC2764900.1 AbrB/MazE/SpoVT family DNA-binding domain-containing protein [Desulfosarcina sp.]